MSQTLDTLDIIARATCRTIDKLVRGWRVSRRLDGVWEAECPDWGVWHDAKSLSGILDKIVHTKPPKD